MIATTIPPLLAVPAVDIGKAEVLALLRCATMKDDFRYLSHGFVDLYRCMLSIQRLILHRSGTDRVST